MPRYPIHGYVYAPDTQPGFFAAAASGALISNPDRSPPFIVVDHAIESVIVARWPGRLWRVLVLDADGIEQASEHAKYTRACAVEVIDEIPAARLFGDHGEAVVNVLTFASSLDEATAKSLAELRHPEAARAYSRVFRRWLDSVGQSSLFPEPDLDGTLAVSRGRSPINYGLSVLHDVVSRRAEAAAESLAFMMDNEGERRLAPPWATAAAALLDTALAFGAPTLAAEDAAILTRAWDAVARA